MNAGDTATKIYTHYYV